MVTCHQGHCGPSERFLGGFFFSVNQVAALVDLVVATPLASVARTALVSGDATTREHSVSLAKPKKKKLGQY